MYAGITRRFLYTDAKVTMQAQELDLQPDMKNYVGLGNIGNQFDSSDSSYGHNALPTS
jgi:hypothetical protein